MRAARTASASRIFAWGGEARGSPGSAAAGPTATRAAMPSAKRSSCARSRSTSRTTAGTSSAGRLRNLTGHPRAGTTRPPKTKTASCSGARAFSLPRRVRALLHARDSRGRVSAAHAGGVRLGRARDRMVTPTAARGARRRARRAHRLRVFHIFKILHRYFSRGVVDARAHQVYRTRQIEPGSLETTVQTPTANV